VFDWGKKLRLTLSAASVKNPPTATRFFAPFFGQFVAKKSKKSSEINLLED